MNVMERKDELMNGIKKLPGKWPLRTGEQGTYKGAIPLTRDVGCRSLTKRRAIQPLIGTEQPALRAIKVDIRGRDSMVA